MSNKLKIYACSGIGDVVADAEKPLGYWSDDTNAISNTQAVNTLLAIINSRNITVQRLLNITPQKRLDYLNDIDMLSIALHAAKKYQNDVDALHRAGMVIDKLLQEGDFDFYSLAGREDHLDTLFGKFEDMMSDGFAIENPSAEFMSWWKTTVEDRNKVGFNFGEQQNIRKALKKAVSGLGAVDESWKENEDLNEYLFNGGKYFLYTYLTDAQLNAMPLIFKAKKAGQVRIYNYCKAFFVDIYGSEEEMQEIIRASIVDQFQEEPETLCETIYENEKRGAKGTGGVVLAATMTIAELIQIITIIAGILIAIVTAICECVYKSNAKKYEALNQKLIDDSCMDENDYNQLENGLNRASTSNILTWGLLGAGLVYLLGKN